MTIDIRANVQSTLGPVISANISDDYIQGNGLIKTRGSCVIAGLVSPKIGTPFKIRYTKNGITRQIPRTLRILSSFADPFRRTTSLQLGCKLTYMEDLAEPINWTALQDQDKNSQYTAQDEQNMVIPIYASSIMERCLDMIDVTAASIPLTSIFSIAEFDFSPGYVQIINDLLVSENYCGYLDQQERLVVISLNQEGGTGPLISSSDVIDIGEINVGQIPGESVIVNYSSFTATARNNTAIGEAPDEESDPFTGLVSNETWTRSSVAISYKNRLTGGEAVLTQAFPVVNGSRESTAYQVFDVIDRETTGKRYLQETEQPSYESSDWERTSVPTNTKQVSLVTSREITEYYSYVSKLGGLATDMLSIGVMPPNNVLSDFTREEFFYNEFGEEYQRVLEKTTSFTNLAASTGLTTVYESESGGSWSRAIPSTVTVPAEKIVTQTYRSGRYSKIVTIKYIPWLYTISGQQAVAAAAEFCESVNDVTTIWNAILAQSDRLILSDTSVEVQIGDPSSQQGPSDAERIKGSLARPNSDPSREYTRPEQVEIEFDQRGPAGYETTSQGSVQLVSGSAEAKRRVEFSMPYAPDDSFYKLGLTYYLKSGDAPAKAKLFGLVQNRLLLGNRNGINIQTAPEKLPSAPFSSLYINMAGTAALYRTNGTSWTIDGNGVIVSTDALYWGLAGKLQ